MSWMGSMSASRYARQRVDEIRREADMVRAAEAAKDNDDHVEIELSPSEEPRVRGALAAQPRLQTQP